MSQDIKPYQNVEQELSAPTNLKSNVSHGKNSFMRDLMALKSLMDKRIQQRGTTVYYLNHTSNKFQSALISCRQLTFSSMKIYKDYIDEYNTEFEQNFFKRTSKANEHLQYLLDCIIACRVFLQAKKKQDAIDILEKVQINQFQKQKDVLIRSQNDKIRFNEKHEIMSKMSAVLLAFIDLAKGERLHQYCDKFYIIYVNYIKNNYGIIQYSTALFKYGCYLYEIKSYEAAQQKFKICVQIRKKNVINSCLVDSLINLSICQRQLAIYNEAIQNTKQAIQIYKDIKINDEGIDYYCLFLAKLCLQAGLFEQAYQNYLKCYKYRNKLPNSHPSKIQIELNFMLFFKVLKDVTEKHKEVLDIQDKKEMEDTYQKAQEYYSKVKNNILERQQFSKYRDFKSSKFSHLSLFITKQFFDSLTSNQVLELNLLLEKLGDMTYQRGFGELQRCSFWQQKKLRDILIEANNHLKKGSTKRGSNSEIGSGKGFI